MQLEVTKNFRSSKPQIKRR